MRRTFWPRESLWCSQRWPAGEWPRRAPLREPRAPRAWHLPAPSTRRRYLQSALVRRLLIGLAALVVLAGGAAGAWYYHDQTRAREKRGSSTVEFVTTAPAVKKRPEKLIEAVPWPMYGYDAARTHDAIQFKLRPPYRKNWTLRVGNIVEFP